MSKCFEEVTKTLIGNINTKTKELTQISASLEKMGVFAKCTDSQRKQYHELLKEISISGQGLEQFVSIYQGF